MSGNSSELRLCVVAYQKDETAPPLVVTRSMVVSCCKTWRVHINGHLLDRSAVPLLAGIPRTLDAGTTSQLLQRLDELDTCAGNPDHKFITFARSKKAGQFLAKDKSVVAFLDDNACVMIDGQEYPVTVRCSKCHLLTKGVRCVECQRYRKVLFAIKSHAVKDVPAQRSKRVNFRYVFIDSQNAY